MKIAKLTFLYVIGAILILSILIWVGYSVLNRPVEQDLGYNELSVEKKLPVEQGNQLEQTTTCEHYIIREYEGKLAIYILANQSKSNKLLKITDIAINSIDQSVSKEYLESLKFDSIEALENYLEGIVS